jgi:CheY-like chemotaxis protein
LDRHPAINQSQSSEKSIMVEKSILIVEDTRDLGRLLQSALATLGADLKVQVVPSAEEALLESPRRKFALAVVDLRLPGITGFELIAKLRARQSDLKVMVITGMLDAEYRQQSEKLKVDAFFTKPLEMGQFLDTVQRLLEIKETPAPAADAASVEAPNLHLPEILASLRQDCAAESVVLLDENGRVVARAGNGQTEALGAESGPLVMAGLSAAQKVWRLLGQGAARGGQIFTGDKLDLLVMPVGDFALLLVYPAGRSLLRLAAALESALALRGTLLDVLTRMGAPVQVLPPVLPAETLAALSEELPPPSAVEPEAEPEPAPESSADAEALGELLSRPGAALKEDDVDAFWSAAGENAAGAALHPDALTYDQARQLGLAPDEGGSSGGGNSTASG